MASKDFRLNFVGDVMLGRLIDQLLPTHVDEPSEAAIIHRLKANQPELRDYGLSHPWGTTLPLLQEGDLNLINLETSVTNSSRKWPEKVFNYRMHPDNIKALHPPGIEYATLANNHTLDFSERGLSDTVDTLRNAGIKFAGAGHTRKEAISPATLTLKNENGQSHNIHVFAGSDHPSDWSSVPNFHLIDYSQKTRGHLKHMLTAERQVKADLKVFSVHWGPNYSWHPAQEIKDLAHYLIDECGVDIIHGHSSHHVQGVERYKGKLIIYGCGDFVDDYALVAQYRNDLSAVWRVIVGETPGNSRLYPKVLEIFPTCIKSFQAEVLDRSSSDHAWVVDKISALSKENGTTPEPQLGDRGQLRFSMTD